MVEFQALIFFPPQADWHRSGLGRFFMVQSLRVQQFDYLLPKKGWAFFAGLFLKGQGIGSPGGEYPYDTSKQQAKNDAPPHRKTYRRSFFRGNGLSSCCSCARGKQFPAFPRGTSPHSHFTEAISVWFTSSLPIFLPRAGKPLYKCCS